MKNQLFPIGTVLFLLGSILLSGCEKVVNIDLNETETRLVVEGWIYNDAGPHWVELSQTTSYFKPESSPRVRGAVLIISDNQGQIDTLQETTPGKYETGHLVGVPGRTYQLRISYSGKGYSAETYLPPVVPIDSLGFIPAEDFAFGGEEGKYLVTFFAIEPQPEKNWYRFNLYKYSAITQKDSLVNDKSGSWIITDDTALKGEVSNLPFEYPFDPGDSVFVEMLSLDRPSYDYLLALQTQLTGDGGMFSPPPANPASNISGKALGYFGASSRVRRGIRIVL
jgi:hypothetical protein